ncbi:BadF/BadG/BcrA/BcrD ATPase family protein [Ruegeria arenilitoris]|uniref:BadF/BadG/BcrA/BcrD ATPase family protein n=1 Tax=Ruegeria arenilitoris TaxID=1173585 RepID=UPI00147CA82C|nr:BadF/BadG/BcrA/BcrD ATPase family protein [Ruegeria arenilitoris]
MTQPINTLILAVDGGGTRCRLAAIEGEVISRVEVGAANVSTNFEAACAELLGGLQVLAAESGREVSTLTRAPTYMGLAGITGEAIARKLAQALPFDRIKIEDDRAAALRGALGEGEGFVAHCGTGSFLASQLSGGRRFSGGWGPVLGDQASAQWVGRRALSETLECVDGLNGSSVMATQLLSRFGGPAGIVQVAAKMTPYELGSLAPVVTEFSDQGDELAKKILQDGADHLAGRLTKMGWVAGLSICLTGGIGPRFGPYLPTIMQSELVEPAGDPLSGAIALVREFLEEIESEHR